MPIPDYQSLMLPFLKIGADGQEHSLREAIESIAATLRLSEEELGELLPSGRQSVFDNRVGWARTYLKNAGMIESTRRGHFRITKRGKETLASGVEFINNKLLKQYQEFQDFMDAVRTDSRDTRVDNHQAVATPEELLQQAYSSIRSSLASELLQVVKGCSA